MWLLVRFRGESCHLLPRGAAGPPRVVRGAGLATYVTGVDGAQAPTVAGRATPEKLVAGHRQPCQPGGMDAEDEQSERGGVFPIQSGAELREKRDRDRQEAHRRYRQRLTAALEEHGVEAAAEVADVALDTLFAIRIRDTADGEECRCACHPHLPDSDLHGYGLDCSCQWTASERVESRRKWLDGIREFWDGPEGRDLAARDQAERDEVRDWAATRADNVVIDELGGACPEQWGGSVDGHRFYFRERHGEWRLELDIRPSGRFVTLDRGYDSGGTVMTEDQEIEEGDIIATGTIEQPGYGNNMLERAEFIVDIINSHLARQACTMHAAERLRAMEETLGFPVLWCPSCGAPAPPPVRPERS